MTEAQETAWQLVLFSRRERARETEFRRAFPSPTEKFPAARDVQGSSRVAIVSEIAVCPYVDEKVYGNVRHTIPRNWRLTSGTPRKIARRRQIRLNGVTNLQGTFGWRV